MITRTMKVRLPRNTEQEKQDFISSLDTAFDLSISEVNYEVMLERGSLAIVSLNKKISIFNITERPAKKGDIVCIQKESSTMPAICVGKCYVVDDGIEGNARIKAIDALGDKHEYFIRVHKDCYVVLEQII